MNMPHLDTYEQERLYDQAAEMDHQHKQDLEQEALDALEHFRNGQATPSEIKLLAYLTCIDTRRIERINAWKDPRQV
jgi:hypothetical protein